MAKGKGILFTLFATIGALTGYATYMANKGEFSEETIDKYDTFLNKAKHVGNDIQRTYTSIGDKTEFDTNTKNLGKNAKKLATGTGDLIVSGATDMYNSAKKNVTKAVQSLNEVSKKKLNKNNKTDTKKNKKASTKNTKTNKKSKK